MDFRQHRHRIQIQESQLMVDDMGGREEAWIPFADCWAKIRPLQGNERYQAQQAQAALSHVIETRYRSGISSRMRVLYLGRVFEILSVVNEGELNKKLLLMCSES